MHLRGKNNLVTRKCCHDGSQDDQQFNLFNSIFCISILEEIKVKNENIHAKIGVIPLKRICKKIAYHDLAMYNVNLQMHQFNEWSLSLKTKKR